MILIMWVRVPLSIHLSIGWMAEWSKASVLKTDVIHLTASSNLASPVVKRISINGKFSAFQAEVMGSSPIVRN